MSDACKLGGIHSTFLQQRNHQFVFVGVTAFAALIKLQQHALIAKLLMLPCCIYDCMHYTLFFMSYLLECSVLGCPCCSLPKNAASGSETDEDMLRYHHRLPE